MANFKYTFYGRVKLKQIECPICGIWQFVGDKSCSECDNEFGVETDRKPSEYRTEPPTWRDKISTSLKDDVYTRDEFICQYCGVHCYESFVENARAVTVDHVIPFVDGKKIMNKDSNNFVPVYTYAAKMGVPLQVVYKWIREKKLIDGDYETKEIKVKRLNIRSNAQHPPYKKRV